VGKLNNHREGFVIFKTLTFATRANQNVLVVAKYVDNPPTRPIKSKQFICVQLSLVNYQGLSIYLH